MPSKVMRPVSYTHLDVYKRQVQYCIFNMGEDHVLYGGKLAVKMGTDQLLNWLDSVEPVSYTHLDVYKRQVIYWLTPVDREMIRAMPMMPIEPAKAVSRVRVFLVQRLSLIHI